MLRQHALQMVLAGSQSVSWSRSGTLRLGRPRGPTTTALPWGPRRVRWRSPRLRRQTDTPSPRSPAPHYRRHRAQGGHRQRDPSLALWHAGTKWESAPRDRGQRGAGPRGGLAHLTASGIPQPRGRCRPAQAPWMGRAAGTGRALRWQGQLGGLALLGPGATGTGAGPGAPWGAGGRHIGHDAARGDAVVGPRDLAAHPARAPLGPPGRASRESGAPFAPSAPRPAGPARRPRGPASAPPRGSCGL